MLLERYQHTTRHASLRAATATCGLGGLPGRTADAQQAQLPTPSQSQDDGKPVLSHTTHIVNTADARIQQKKQLQVHLPETILSAKQGTTTAGAAQSSQARSEKSSSAEHEKTEQNRHGQGESPNDNSDSDDDIQVHAMDRTALLSSLVGSGAAEGAIESLVASLKY